MDLWGHLLVIETLPGGSTSSKAHCEICSTNMPLDAVACRPQEGPGHGITAHNTPVQAHSTHNVQAYSTHNVQACSQPCTTSTSTCICSLRSLQSCGCCRTSCCCKGNAQRLPSQQLTPSTYMPTCNPPPPKTTKARSHHVHQHSPVYYMHIFTWMYLVSMLDGRELISPAGAPDPTRPTTKNQHTPLTQKSHVAASWPITPHHITPCVGQPHHNSCPSSSSEGRVRGT